MMHSIRFEQEHATMGFVISSGTIMLTLQNAILEMIAKGEPLSAVIHALCVRVEAAIPWTVCSVLAVRDGHMHPLAGPSLPPAYSQTIDNLAIGPLAGSC